MPRILPRKKYGFYFVAVIFLYIFVVVQFNGTSTPPPGQVASPDLRHAGNRSGGGGGGGGGKRPRYYIGVMADCNLLPRAKSVFNTWAGELSQVQFFIGGINNCTSPQLQSLPLVQMTGVSDGVYPMLHKGFGMLRHWCANKQLYFSQFDWFIRADDDVYVKIRSLERLLAKLDPKEQYYVGRQGFGKTEDIPKLELNGRCFCTGPFVIFSKALLQGLCPHVEDCLAQAVTDLEDTEWGRCVQKHVGKQCSQNLEMCSRYKMNDLFFHSYDLNYFHTSQHRRKTFSEGISFHKITSSATMELLHRWYKEELATMTQPSQDVISRSQIVQLELDSPYITWTYHVSHKLKRFFLCGPSFLVS